MPPRHSSSRPRRNPAARKVVLVGAGIVALIVVIGLVVAGISRVGGGGGGFCGARDTVTLTVEPALEDAARTLADSAEDKGCVRFTVTAASSADVSALADGREQLPDLWIPDSAVRLARVSQDVQVPFETVLNSVASSPVVIASRGVDVDMDSWTAALSTEGLTMGDPTLAGTADAPILAATAEVESMRATKEALGSSLATLAQGQSGKADERPGEAELLEQVVTTGGATIVSEQQGVRSLRDRKDSGVKLGVPRSGAVFLTYPLAVAAQDPARRDIASEAATALRDAATSTEFGKKLREEGFRPADRAPLPDGEGVGEVEALVVRDPNRLETTLQRWKLLSLPSRALVLMDTSGSMTTPVEGTAKNRIEVLVENASLGLGQFPDDAALGVWAFGGDVGTPERPYREVAPIGQLGSTTPGGTQRQVLGAALKSLPGLVGGGTDLYVSVLDAIDSLQRSYDPATVNSVIVISDGANDNVSQLSKEEFLDRLRAKVDPKKPVIVVTIGILDADQATLAEISRATGGSSHIARAPREIAKVFAEAIQQRGNS